MLNSDKEALNRHQRIRKGVKGRRRKCIICLRGSMETLKDDEKSLKSDGGAKKGDK